MASQAYIRAKRKLLIYDIVFSLVMGAMIAAIIFGYNPAPYHQTEMQNIQAEIDAIDLEIKKIDWILEQP